VLGVEEHEVVPGDNKVVLVSGGARGQGAAEARLLVAQGAKVVIGDVLDNQGQTLAAELGPARPSCGTM
jgi:3alpha(or 20beta)-hydroxysteroid dehydrogenase